MNNKGQTFALVFISLIVIFIIGLTMTNFLMDEVTTARTGLTCSDSENISDGTKLLCLVVDVAVIYWILGILGVIFSVIAGRML